MKQRLMILDKLLLVAYLAYYQNNFYNMFNIVLISTEHREFGNCNSDELCKILESINPDVIFEEEPNDVIRCDGHIPPPGESFA